MKKLSVVLLSLAAAVTSTYFIACNSSDTKTATTDTTERPKTNEDSLKKVLERGEYLTKHVAICLDCHSKRDKTKYSLPIIPGTEGGGGNEFNHEIDHVPGVIFSRNITPDEETGIGTWTDAEVLRAVTQGISKNGDTLFPLMPYHNYNKMAKEDLLSIIAYIRTLKPIKNKNIPRKLMLPYISLAYPPGIKSSVDSNMRPPLDNKIANGGYLATMASCADCHTPMVNDQYDFSRPFAGSFLFTETAFKVNSANITPDSATGIGAWTEERFMNKFLPYRKEEAYAQDPGKQNTIMPLSAYAGMDDYDLKAIYAFLKSLPAIKNKVEKYPK